MSSSPGQCINSRWKVKHLVGIGSCAEVYEGMDLSTQTLVAIKIERNFDTSFPILQKEYSMYNVLNSTPSQSKGFPKIHHLHAPGKPNALVMDLLGSSIGHIFKRNKYIFSNLTIMRIGLQLIGLVEKMHQNGIMHCDIHGGNLLIGRNPQDSNIVHIVDFGNALKLSIHQQIYIKDLVDVIHFLILLFSEEMISVKHTLTNPYKIECKWRADMCIILKATNKIRANIGHLPAEVFSLVWEIGKIKFSHNPNYFQLTQCFETYFQRVKSTKDGPFDWK